MHFPRSGNGQSASFVHHSDLLTLIILSLFLFFWAFLWLFVLLSFSFLIWFQPVMDGFTCVEALHRAGCTLPIFALSANPSSQVRVRCASLGFTGFLLKPVRSSELLSILDRFITHTMPLHIPVPLTPLPSFPFT